MITMYIGEEEVVCNKEFEIDEEMLTTSSTVLNNCYPKSWEENHDYIGNFYYPEDYSKFRLYKDNNLIFCGVVKNTGNISLNPRDPKYCSLQILDFKTFLSEGDTLDYVISGKTITQAIQMVVDSVVTYGFTLGEVNILNGNDVIGAYSTQNKTAYDVFQYLADISGSKWSTRMVDENTVAIDFYDPTLMPRTDDIEYTKEYFEDNDIIDITFNYGTYDYRNKQIMLSDQVYADIDYTEIIYGDGYNTTFSTTENIGNIKSIYVNGSAATYATKEEKELGFDADFYYEPGKEQLEASTTYATGTAITITYTPLIKGRQIVYNSDEVTRISNNTSRNGVITRYENRNDILYSSDLEKIGQTYIKYKGVPEIKLNIQTKDNDLFNIGDVAYFDAPIEQLQLEYMVKSKKTKIIAIKSTLYVFYEYELTSSFNAENAINYFDNQRAKAAGNIEAGNFVSRNIDINQTANIIFDNYREQELSSGNVLDCVLDAVLNS